MTNSLATSTIDDPSKKSRLRYRPSANSFLTALLLAGLVYLLLPFFKWAILDATWVGTTRSDCVDTGACWVFVKVWLPRFVYGFYPDAEVWRANVCFAICCSTIAWVFCRSLPGRRYAVVFLVLVFPFLNFAILRGGFLGLASVQTDQWGGLLLTMVVASIGIIASLPLGILLALGRRSQMPLVQSLCAIFIELWRGVPLITVLFMASVMFPLFLPPEMHVDKLVRALVAVALFSGAIMAEVVRGGLQAVSRGQYEAASALGMGYWTTISLIVLPQALKIVVPGVVNIFISLFKDTVLVGIISLFDFLLMIQTALTNPDWLGLRLEGYLFAAAVFGSFCFGISRLGRNIERELAKSHNR